MSHKPAQETPDADSSPSKHSTPAEEFISLLVPEPDLPEEEMPKESDGEEE